MPYMIAVSLEMSDEPYFISHAYSVAEEGAPKLIIREMTWTPDGWPIVNF